ncbi:hypothetical protein T03_7748 [Trichinella britovi]|uniref:Uncharacterized protein n=1 Tax=Trichinella britovi TaxID=45882 RepID=A0A0V0YTI8_TRIBR|nr:hypothetical protein T03_7748 [Trichinella britovi]
MEILAKFRAHLTTFHCINLMVKIDSKCQEVK